MAELDPKIVELMNRLAETIESVNDKLSNSTKNLGKQLKNRADEIAKSNQSLVASALELRKQQKEGTIDAERANKIWRDLHQSAKDLGSEYKTTADRVAKLSGSFELQNQKVLQATKGAGEFALGMTSAVADFTKNLQNSTSGLDFTKSLGNSVIGGLGKTATGLGDGLKGLSDVIPGTTRGQRALKIGAEIASVGLKGVGAAAPAVSKIFDVLVDQLKAVNDGYNKSVKAGAIFAGSYGDFAQSAKDAGLTVRQFGEFMGKNADVLGQTGLDITKAAQQVGKVGKVLRDSGTDEKLMKLGFGFEEQAEVTARVMADMRRAGRDVASVGTGEIAEQTEKYATNLRVISALTGEDAKKLKEKARQELSNLGVQAEIQRRTRQGDVGATQRFEAVQSLASSSGKLVNDAARQLLGSTSSLMGDTAKQFALLGPAGEEFKQKILEIKNDPNLDPSEAASRMNDAVAALNKGIRENEGTMKLLGTAAEMGGSKLGGYSASIAELLDKTNKAEKGKGEVAKDSAEAAKNAQDDLTNGIVASNKALQQMQMTVDKDLNKVLPTFSKQIGAATTELSKFISGASLPEAAGMGIAGMALGAISSFLPEILKTAFTKATGTGAAGAAEGAAAGAAEGAAAKGVTKDASGRYRDASGKFISKEAGAAAEAEAQAAAKGASTLSKGARVLGKAGGALTAVAVEGYESYGQYQEAEEQRKAGLITDKEANKKKTEAVAGGIGGVGGALGGAAAGAAIGSVVPVVGTIIGGIVGGMLGAWAGRKVGEGSGGALFKVADAVLPDSKPDAQVNVPPTPAGPNAQDTVEKHHEALKEKEKIKDQEQLAQNRENPMDRMNEILIALLKAQNETTQALLAIKTNTEKTAQRVA
jgi:hypothetical protein